MTSNPVGKLRLNLKRTFLIGFAFFGILQRHLTGGLTAGGVKG